MGILDRLLGKKVRAAEVQEIAGLERESDDHAEEFWRKVYDVRGQFLEAAFGPLPEDILKLGDLMGVWPGGGLYVIPARRLGADRVIYTTFGLTNPDMPSRVTITDSRIERNGEQVQRTEVTLKAKENPRLPNGRPGYGYELIVVADENAEWPLWLLQWAVKAEILKDADFIGRVEKYKGLTVEQIQIGDNKFTNFLFAKAQAPLPISFDLPNGRAEILVATAITADEMQWSMTHGRDALLTALQGAGLGQVSVLDRPSVVSGGLGRAPSDAETPPIDFANIRSREAAAEMAAHGKLFKILLFPVEFGGEDVALNITYVPAGIVELKDETTRDLMQVVRNGLVDKLNVRPEYKGESVIPCKLRIEATHSTGSGRFERTIDIW